MRKLFFLVFLTFFSGVSKAQISLELIDLAANHIDKNEGGVLDAVIQNTHFNSIPAGTCEITFGIDDTKLEWDHSVSYKLMAGTTWYIISKSSNQVVYRNTTEIMPTEIMILAIKVKAKKGAEEGDTRFVMKAIIEEDSTVSNAHLVKHLKKEAWTIIEGRASIADSQSLMRTFSMEGEKEIVKITAYPNPVNDILTIQIEPEKPIVRNIELINNAGQVVYTSNNIPVDGIKTGKMPVGIYVVKITYTDGTFATKKILKQ